jgi:hypothetical protein
MGGWIKMEEGRWPDPDPGFNPAGVTAHPPDKNYGSSPKFVKVFPLTPLIIAKKFGDDQNSLFSFHPEIQISG